MKKIIVIVFVLIPLFAFSQKIVHKNKYRTVTVYKHQPQNWPVTFSAFSPYLFHTGIAAQTDFILSERRKEVNRLRLLRYMGFHLQNKIKTKSRYFILQPGFFLYNQKGFHTGVIVNCMAKSKWVRYRGMTYELGVGLGALWTIYPGKTYVVKENGDIKERYFASRIYLANQISAGIGYDFSKAKHWKHNGAVLLEGISTFALPMGASVGFLNYFQLGYRFQISGFTKKMNNKWHKK